MSDYEKLARAVLKQYEIEIDERALPAIVETELLLQVPALARAVLDQQKTIERLEQEVKLADDDARKMRDAYSDSLRDWAEGGKVWKFQQEIKRLQAIIGSYEQTAERGSA